MKSFWLITGIVLGATAVHFIPKAYAATAFVFTTVNVTGSVPAKSFERYENDEVICYKYGNLSCVKKP